MTKNSDSQDVKKNKGGARRRPNGGKSFISQFQWDSVDDQAQEDLIVPTSTPKRKSAKASRRRDKDVGTMYVSSSDSFAAPKKKPRPEPRLEEIADFVADIDDGEEDGFATPSYGRTKLTRDDEELVEELATKKEKAPRKPKRAPKVEIADEVEENDAADAPARQPKKNERKRGDERNSSKNDGEKDAKKTRVDRAQKTPETRENAGGKRSFLAKIKEAISTGTISRDEPEAAAETRISPQKMRRLTQNTKQILDATGVSSEKIDALGGGNQLDDLTVLLEALIQANLTLIEATKNRERRPARAVEEIFEIEPRQASEKTARPERRERPRREERVEKPAVEVVDEPAVATEKVEKIEKPKRRRDEKPRRETFVDEDDFDPIARWENMADDEPESAEPAASVLANDDFDDWDEAATKKKSGRFGQKTEKEPSFETPSPKLTDDETPTPPAEKPKKSRRREERGEKLEPSAKKSAKPLEKFGDLTLERATLKALQAIGYVAPTPIQAGTIARVQAGVDLMGQAQTGTGKTAAFMIPVIEGVDACEPSSDPLALVVVPTRELSVQVRDEAIRLAQFRDLHIVACYGGKPIASQVEKIRRGVDILIGTPGRIIDLTNRGALSLSSVRWVVLDEADRMLDIGFRPDVEKILRKTPSSRQTLLFSATLAPPVVRLAKAYMRDPEQHDFSQRDVSADTIEQFYLTVDHSRKFDALVRLLETQDPRQAIVFCRTKRSVDAIGRRLAAKFSAVEAIHGDLQQSKRDRIMANFRAEKAKILVATDVVGRGIDVSSVSHIINYDVPQYCDDYVHRVGRAGRMGREGVAFTLVTTEEGAELTRIEIRINRLLERMELPGFEAYSKPVEGPGASAEPDRFERKPVFGQTRRRERRAL